MIARPAVPVNSTQSSCNPTYGFLMRLVVLKFPKLPLRDRVCSFGRNDDQKVEKSGCRSLDELEGDNKSHKSMHSSRTFTSLLVILIMSLMRPVTDTGNLEPPKTRVIVCFS